MNSTIELDLAVLIDDAIESLVEKKIPPLPRIIAQTMATVFCKGFTDTDYADYREQIELAALERWRVYLGRHEKIDLGRN